MLVVAALGGNALLRRGEPADVATQRAHVRTAVEAIARLATEHDVVVTHGNGPQVGLLALQAEAYEDVDPYPLDVLGAETEGMIGYLLDQELVNELGGAPVATLLTQVVVDAADPAFERPTKPIGPVYDPETAERLATVARGWTLWRGPGWSAPRGGVARAALDRRAADDSAAGREWRARGLRWRRRHPRPAGRPWGRCEVEAVIDKDLAALLACSLDAEGLLLLTDVFPAVEVGWGTPDARPLDEVTSAALRARRLRAGLAGTPGRGRVPLRRGDRRPGGHRSPCRRGRDPPRRARDPRPPGRGV